MSPAESSKKPGGPYRKPRTDLYTVLLILALAAILLGILCLYFEMRAYDFKMEGGPTVSADHPSALALADYEGAGTRDRRPAISSALATYRPLIPDP